MLRTIEAIIDSTGQVTLNEAVSVTKLTRALVTILDESSPLPQRLNEAAILAESALADGWSGPEADQAWAHLAELPDLD